jgi:peptidoglycan hydrolase-like protein with peptidoglycan-binding domain
LSAASLALVAALAVPAASGMAAEAPAPTVAQVPDAGIRPAPAAIVPAAAHVPTKARPVFDIKPMIMGVGASGSAVLEIQKKLAALHYDVGAVTGTYGFDTAHAVTAFQKLNGLSRTGIADDATKARLDHPYMPSARYGGAAHVEVDLSSQVVYYVVGGSIQRIMDASTGGGYDFVVDGVTHHAITPTGAYTLYQVIPGWWESPVGPMYDSWFFLPTFALHGEGSVPPYPASHGCVRITIPAMQRLYGSLYIGMTIDIYA